MRPRKQVLLIGTDEEWLGRTRFLLDVRGYASVTCVDRESIRKADLARMACALVLVPEGGVLTADYSVGDLNVVVYGWADKTEDTLIAVGRAALGVRGPKRAGAVGTIYTAVAA